MITIRTFQEQEASLLADISRTSFFQTFAPDNTEENMSLFLQHQFTAERIILEMGQPGNTHLLALYNDEPAGYIFLKQRSHPLLESWDALEISRIYCLQAFQGKGVGKTLMEYAIQFANQLKLDTLWLAVWKENAKALNFYNAFGFQIFGETDFMLGKDLQKDWLMSKPIKFPLI